MNRLAITPLLINNKSFISYIILDEKRNFVDFQLFQEEHYQIGDIYIGRIDKIVKNINAAFVSISETQKCYLSLENFSDAIYVKKNSKNKDLSEGDLILVQITKDAVKTKDPVVSEKLSLHGKYCILTTGNKSFGISKKINGAKRKELEDILKEIQETNDVSSYGMLLRTDAAFINVDELRNDVLQVIDAFDYINTIQIHRNMYTLVYKSVEGFISRIKATNLDLIDKVYTDDLKIYDTLKKELSSIYQDKLVYYNDNSVSLKTLYGIESKINELISNKVWLKSGANIIIEQLETITFIDINSAKNVKHSDEIAFSINSEAVKAIALQLKLRNISGMIIVDFINMNSKEQDEILIKQLSAELAKDVTSCQVIDITKLGLVEITRKKTYKSLKEMIY